MGDIVKEISVPAPHMQNIFGQFDGHIKKLERHFRVSIADRNGSVAISGEERAVEKCVGIIRELTELSERGNSIKEQTVDYAITMGMDEKEEVLLEIDKDMN